MASTDRHTVESFRTEQQRLVEQWRELETCHRPNREKLAKPELKAELTALVEAESAHHDKNLALERQYFGHVVGVASRIETPADLWAYITLVAVKLVEFVPNTAAAEINKVLNFFGSVGLPTPPEPASSTPDQAIRVLRRLADELFPVNDNRPQIRADTSTVRELSAMAASLLEWLDERLIDGRLHRPFLGTFRQLTYKLRIARFRCEEWPSAQFLEGYRLLSQALRWDEALFARTYVESEPQSFINEPLPWHFEPEPATVAIIRKGLEFMAKAEAEPAVNSMPIDTTQGEGKIAGGESEIVANRHDGLKKVDAAERRAYLAFLYAESKRECRLEDRVAWDWLKENGFDPPNAGELAEYKLPRFDTWVRQVRAARNATGEQKYQKRNAADAARSIVRADDLD